MNALSGEVLIGLAQANSLLTGAIDRQLRELCQLSQAQFEILVRLSYAPDGMRMSDLASVLVFSASGLTYQATQLEKRGLLERAKSTDGDERTVVARITQEGRRLIAEVQPRHLALVQEVLFDKMTPSETQVMADVLGRVVEGLRQRG